MKRIFLLMVLSWFVALAGCAKKPCILPALQRQQITDKKAVEVGGQLQQLPASGNLKTDFQKSVDQNFSQLPNEDMALFLFLTAIDCYLQRGEAGKDIAATLAQGVREKYLSVKKFAGASPGPELTALELAKLRESKQYGEQIIHLYRGLGFKAD